MLLAAGPIEADGTPEPNNVGKPACQFLRDLLFGHSAIYTPQGSLQRFGTGRGVQGELNFCLANRQFSACQRSYCVFNCDQPLEGQTRLLSTLQATHITLTRSQYARDLALRKRVSPAQKAQANTQVRRKLPTFLICSDDGLDRRMFGRSRDAEKLSSLKRASTFSSASCWAGDRGSFEYRRTGIRISWAAIGGVTL